MSPTDTALLTRWRESRDADAFHELVNRYANLVYAASHRVIANSADAEDVTQECFLTLAEKPPQQPRSLGAWLHRVATNRALQRIREQQRRRKREERADLPSRSESNAEWEEMSQYIDEAIAELPPNLRELVVDHYLGRQTQSAIAERLGISRQTVTSRLRKAVELIRTNLKRKGIGVSVAVLTQGLAERLAEAAPVSVLKELGKIAVAGKFASRVSALSTKIVSPVGLAAGIGIIGVLSAFLVLNVRDGFTLRDSPASIETDSERTAITQKTPSASQRSASLSARDDNAPAEREQRPAARSTIQSSGLISASSTPQFGTDVEESPGLIESPNARVRLSGFVVNKEGVPVSDARITVVATGYTGLEIEPEQFRAFRNPRHHYVARSDARGQYSIEGIAYAGNARINVWADRYGNVESQFMVQPGGEPITLNITLPRKGLLLKARVLNNSGIPVDDAFVVAPTWRANNGMSRSQPRFFGRSDENGHIQLGFAMLGGSAGNAGHAHLLVSSPSAGVGSFEMVPIGQDKVVDLRLKPAATMRGLIESSPELGLVPRKVILSEVIEINGFRDFGYTSTYIAPVDGEGTYILGAVPPGREFKLWVMSETNGDVLPRETLEPFAPGEVRTVNRTAGNGVVLKGTVFGEESRKRIPHVRIGHGFDAWQIIDGERTWTDEFGDFTLVVSAELESINMFPAHAFIRESQLQELAKNFGERFDLQESLYEDVDLRIPDPIDLTILAEESDGSPVPHAAVIVHGTQLGYTSSEGICRLALHPVYVRDLELRKHGFVHSTSEQHVFESISPTEMLARAWLQRAAGGLEGWFTYSDGTPIVNARVEVLAKSEDDMEYSTDGETNAEGRFTLLDWCPVGQYHTIEISLEHEVATGRSTVEDVEMVLDEVLILDPIVGQ